MAQTTAARGTAMTTLGPTPTADDGPDLALTPRDIARIGAAMFIASGVVTAVNPLLPEPAAVNNVAVTAIAAFAMFLGCVAWFLPWQRWPRSYSLAYLPLAFALIALHNYFGGADPYRFGIYFLVTHTWIGIGQPRWTSVKFAPLFAVAYLAPLLATPHSPTALSSVAYTLPVCLLVAELLAWVSTQLGTARWAMHRSEGRFRSLLQNASDLITVVDGSGTIVDDSPAIERVLGYPAGSRIGQSGTAYIHPDDVAGGLRMLGELAVRPSGNRTVKIRERHANGSWRWFEATATNLLHDANVGGIVVNQHDVTDRQRADDALRTSEARFRSLVQNGSDVILILAADASITYVSPSVERVLGYQTDAVVGHSAFEFIRSDHISSLQQAFANVYATPGAHQPVEFWARHADGSWHCLEATANNLLDDPDVRGIVQNVRDVTERKLLEEELKRQALHDPLTGLPNRALFMDRLEHALAAAARDGRRPSVLFLDLDRFKLINDSLGHGAGDALLVAVGERLRGCLRPADTIARFGGDEFIILLDESAEPADAAQAAGRIIAALNRPFRIDGTDVYTAASVGIARGGAQRGGAIELVREADVALYEAKAAGRGRYAVYDAAMHARTADRLQLERDLRDALERDELQVHFQPEVELVSGRIVGVEALVRWQHATRGLVPPMEFIPLAEETGLIYEIGRRVMRRACRQARVWQERYPLTPLQVSVNLSAHEFGAPGLAERIGAVLRDEELEPRRLRLEIAESVVMKDADATIGRLQALRELGVQLAIDDFGTGYSSLGELRRFPVNAVKVDRSFVAALGTESGAFSVVQAIVGLGHALGIDVAAEGIETAAQLGLVRELDCDRGQGYCFARPLPAEALEAVLDAGTIVVGPTPAAPAHDRRAAS